MDEEDTVKLKGKQSGEVLVHRNDLQRDGLRRTGSRSRRPGPPPRGPHPPGDPGGAPCAEKAAGAANGIGPAGDPGLPQGGAGARASTAPSAPPAHPFLEGGGAGETDRALPAPGETGVVGNGDPRVSSGAECPAAAVPDHAPRIPAPDYPPHRGAAGAHVDRGGKEEVFQDRAGEQGSRLPFPVSEAMAARVLSGHLEEEGAAPAAPVAHGSPPGGGEAEEEDAEVAEALAALAAATAGEDVDDVE